MVEGEGSTVRYHSEHFADANSSNVSNVGAVSCGREDDNKDDSAPSDEEGDIHIERKREQRNDGGSGGNFYAEDEDEQSSSHGCADCTKSTRIGSSLASLSAWPWKKQKPGKSIANAEAAGDYRSLVDTEYKKLVGTKPVVAAFLTDECAGQEEQEGRKYDALAKEAQLRAEANIWADTAKPKPARPGDVPVIDVSRWFQTNDTGELHRLGAALRKASEQVGFFILSGHEIPPVELNSILVQTKLFHSLPNDAKHALAMDMPDHHVSGVGFLGHGNWKLPSRSKPNLNAAFLVKTDHCITYDDNRWPQEEILPGFRGAVERYSTLVTGLAKRLLPIYAVALDLPADYFLDAFEDPFFRLRLTHYRSMDKGDDEGFGIHPHVDTSFITLLLTDGTPGLNIFSHQRQEWIMMPSPHSDAFIVNSGELLRQWSNDRFLSTRHFVSNASCRDRYSVPLFFTPNSDYKMECLPTCCGPDNHPKYPPFSYNESQGIIQGE